MSRDAECIEGLRGGVDGEVSLSAGEAEGTIDKNRRGEVERGYSRCS